MYNPRSGNFKVASPLPSLSFTSSVKSVGKACQFSLSSIYPSLLRAPAYFPHSLSFSSPLFLLNPFIPPSPSI